MRAKSYSSWIGPLVVVALVLALQTVVNAPASADTGWGEVPDTGNHTYCYRDGNPPNQRVSDRIHWSMDVVEAQTVVNTVFKDGCRAHTDAMFRQRFFRDRFFGVTTCNRWRSNGRCDRFLVTISWGEIRQYADHNRRQARKTACHEIGHTLGVDHYRDQEASPDGRFRNSCMRSGVWDDGAWWQKHYGPHHIDVHINPWWS